MAKDETHLRTVAWPISKRVYVAYKEIYDLIQRKKSTYAVSS